MPGKSTARRAEAEMPGQTEIRSEISDASRPMQRGIAGYEKRPWDRPDLEVSGQGGSLQGLAKRSKWGKAQLVLVQRKSCQRRTELVIMETRGPLVKVGEGVQSRNKKVAGLILLVDDFWRLLPIRW